MALGYGMYDADGHLYEAHDAFTRHLPDHRRRDVYWMTDQRGHQKLIFGRKVYDYIPNPTFDPVAVAGAFDRSKVEPLSNHPEYLDRDARLRVLDEQEIEATLMFPTLINGLYELIGDDIPLFYDVLDAYNRWLDDDWGCNYKNRIYATPNIPLADPVRAIAMLDWAISRGARAIMVAAAPARTPMGYRSPADPMFDEFWRKCADNGVVVNAHAGANGYQRYSGDLTGNHESRPFVDQTVDHIINFGRAIADFFTVLVWQGTFMKFPTLKVTSVENNSAWVAPLLSTFKRFYRSGTGGAAGSLAADPIELFQQHVWINPHWDEDLDALAAAISDERILAGSDWPHYNSLADPASFVKYLDGMSETAKRNIMRDNLRSLLV
ncbi:MAG: amidohydrolase family protein [Acidimicrobiia bacterium]